MTTSTCQELRQQSDEEIAAFINSFDTVLTDCDGVLWFGLNPILGSSDVINLFRELGKKVYYVTNNSTKHRRDFLKKCIDLKFGGTQDEVLGTAYLAAWYLKSRNFEGKVYMIGESGLAQELDDVGIEHIGLGPDLPPKEPFSAHVAVDIVKELDPDVNCVIVAFDFNISYPKIIKAINYLEKPGVIFLASNTDERFPMSPYALPGTGSIVASVTVPAERDPVILGKPNTFFFEAVRQRCPNVEPQRTLMIGDRANTDILLGKNCNLKTLQVGGGVHKLSDIRRWEKSACPKENRLVADYYLDSLGDLLPLMQRVRHLLK
uniref:Phosphoglycolate phosphatase n=1 Tax=Lepeophtheirus salmonis TaxID=72036 RepID=A0A0K2UIP7_LEPSM